MAKAKVWVGTPDTCWLTKQAPVESPYAAHNHEPDTCRIYLSSRARVRSVALGLIADYPRSHLILAGITSSLLPKVLVIAAA